MNHQYYNVLGVMSGTSLDGLDIAHLSLVYKNSWNFQIEKAVTIPYPKTWKQELAQAVHLTREQTHSLNSRYTQYLGAQIKSFIDQHQIKGLMAVCSHGHTVHHQPETGYTLQIGNLPELAQITGQRVVCDFRVQDVQLGGQGAPLVPIGDALLFGDYDYCINLGGFANVSYAQDKQRIAFDICAVNVVLNHFAEKLGENYDAGGAFAKAGTPQAPVLAALNQLAFYDREAPKSLGMEWVQKGVMPILLTIPKPENVLATYVEHIAQQISRVVRPGAKILITGGGAFNRFLIDRISFYAQAQISLPDAQTIAFKEALIFGLLGVLRLRNQPNCLASVTGAQKDHSSGVIWHP